MSLLDCSAHYHLPLPDTSKQHSRLWNHGSHRLPVNFHMCLWYRYDTVCIFFIWNPIEDEVSHAVALLLTVHGCKNGFFSSPILYFTGVYERTRIICSLLQFCAAHTQKLNRLLARREQWMSWAWPFTKQTSLYVYHQYLWTMSRDSVQEIIFIPRGCPTLALYLLFTVLRVLVFIVLFCEQQAMAISHYLSFCRHNLLMRLTWPGNKKLESIKQRGRYDVSGKLFIWKCPGVSVELDL